MPRLKCGLYDDSFKPRLGSPDELLPSLSSVTFSSLLSSSSSSLTAMSERQQQVSVPSFGTTTVDPNDENPSAAAIQPRCRTTDKMGHQACGVGVGDGDTNGNHHSLSRSQDALDEMMQSSWLSRVNTSMDSQDDDDDRLRNDVETANGSDEEIVTHEMMQAWLHSRNSTSTKTQQQEETTTTTWTSTTAATTSSITFQASQADRARTSYLSWDDYFMATACLSALRSKEPTTTTTDDNDHNKDTTRGGCCIIHAKTKRILAVGYTGFPSCGSDHVLPWHAQAPPAPSPDQHHNHHHHNNNNNNNNNNAPLPESQSQPQSPSPAATDNNNNNNDKNNRWLWTREPYVVHAAVNAILNNSKGLAGGRMYLTHFPCHECAKILIQAGIRKVIYKKQQRKQQQQQQEQRPTYDQPHTQTDPLLQVVSCCSYSANNNNDQEVEESVAASRIMLQLAGVKVQIYRPQQTTPIRISLQSHANSSSPEQQQQQQQQQHGSNKNSDMAKSTTTGGQKAPPSIPNNPNQYHQQHHYHHHHRSSSPNEEQHDLQLRHKFRELLMRETRGYDPVVQSSGRRTTGILLSWPDYFMALASLTAQRSKDPNTQVGACLVDSHTNRIVGLGYNGFPTKCSDQVLPWGRRGANNHDISSKLLSKYMYVCHAEVNAILNRIDTTTGASSACASWPNHHHHHHHHHQHVTLYVALFPCHACAKVIVQAGNIRRIVYQHDKYHDTDSCRASRILLTMADIELIPYQRISTDITDAHNNNNSITIALS